MKYNNIYNKYLIIDRTLKRKIKESIDEEKLDDINNKLNVVMDALGLEIEEVQKDETVVDVETETDNNDETVEFNVEEETVTEDETVGESLNITTQYKYVVKFSENAKYKYWFNDVKNKINSDNSIGFYNIDELTDFLQNSTPNFSQRSYEVLVDSDKNNQSGVILSNIYYTVFKNED